MARVTTNSSNCWARDGYQLHLGTTGFSLILEGKKERKTERGRRGRGFRPPCSAIDKVPARGIGANELAGL